jgi:hypothetical protein
VQEDPPRLLAYKASAIHRYGWIPLNPLNWRNVRATVFRSGNIHVQTALLVAWTAIIHATGLGFREYDLHGFLKAWGTVYSGAPRRVTHVVCLACCMCKCLAEMERAACCIV